MGHRRLVQIEDTEVEVRLLEVAGGPFPNVWAGRPVTPPTPGPYPEHFGPFPRTGWRRVSGALTWPGDADPPVLAAPAAEPGLWWLAFLTGTGGSWHARSGWPERVRPSRSDRTRGLLLAWPRAPIVTTPAGLADVPVLLSRDGVAALDWDEADHTHVVGWVIDEVSGKPLPFDRHQAFGGPGPRPLPYAAGVAALPVRWITRDVHRLPPGRYAIKAQLADLDVATERGVLELVRG